MSAVCCVLCFFVSVHSVLVLVMMFLSCCFPGVFCFVVTKHNRMPTVKTSNGSLNFSGGSTCEI